jgi:hypothetical protein
MCSFASGNVIAATVIPALSTSTFYIIMTGFTIAAFVYFFFLKKPRAQSEASDFVETEEVGNVNESRLRQSFLSGD